MSARLVQHLSCLLILIHKVKELLPFWKVIAKIYTYSEENEDYLLGIVNGWAIWKMTKLYLCTQMILYEVCKTKRGCQKQPPFS